MRFFVMVAVSLVLVAKAEAQDNGFAPEGGRTVFAPGVLGDEELSDVEVGARRNIFCSQDLSFSTQDFELEFSNNGRAVLNPPAEITFQNPFRIHAIWNIDEVHFSESPIGLRNVVFEKKDETKFCSRWQRHDHRVVIEIKDENRVVRERIVWNFWFDDDNVVVLDANALTNIPSYAQFFSVQYNPSGNSCFGSCSGQPLGRDRIPQQ